MIAAGIKNISLTKYLIEQVRQSPDDRIKALREYVPTAKTKDWVMERAGQRVQVIKRDEKEGGILEFGTEINDYHCRWFFICFAGCLTRRFNHCFYYG